MKDEKPIGKGGIYHADIGVMNAATTNKET